MYKVTRQDDGRFKCELSTECENEVTHIDSGEWLACRKHADARRKKHFKVRELSAAELKRLQKWKNLYE